MPDTKRIHDLLATQWSGFMPTSARQVRLKQREQLRGIGVLRGDWQTQPAQITTIHDVADLATAKQVIAQANAIALLDDITVIDQFGDAWVHVCPASVAVVGRPVQNADATWMVTLVWLLVVPVDGPEV